MSQQSHLETLQTEQFRCVEPTTRFNDIPTCAPAGPRSSSYTCFSFSGNASSGIGLPFCCPSCLLTISPCVHRSNTLQMVVQQACYTPNFTCNMRSCPRVTEYKCGSASCCCHVMLSLFKPTPSKCALSSLLGCKRTRGKDAKAQLDLLVCANDRPKRHNHHQPVSSGLYCKVTTAVCICSTYIRTQMSQ